MPCETPRQRWAGKLKTFVARVTQLRRTFFVYCFLSFSWVLARLCGNGKRPQIHFGQARATCIVHAEVCWNYFCESKTTYKKRMCVHSREANKQKTAFNHLCIFVRGHGFPVAWAWQWPFHRARPFSDWDSLP